jgi:hypothetical protein
MPTVIRRYPTCQNCGKFFTSAWAAKAHNLIPGHKVR